MKLKLIDEWRRAHKFATVQLSVFFVALFGIGPDLIHTWAFLPDDLKMALPDGTGRWVACGAFALTLLGRIFKLDREPSKDDCQ